MSVTFVLEHAPQAQSETQRVYLGGQLVIGRSDDCDWRLDDPEKFVSRKHCIITDEDGQIRVVDASSGGVFVDGASEPLGTGNSHELEHQMRLRLGDFVIRVEMESAKTAKPAADSSNPDSIFEWGEVERKEPTVRPDDLPQKFRERAATNRASADVANKPAVPPLERNNPFELDLEKRDTPDESVSLAPSVSGSGGGYFDPPAPKTTDKMPAPENPIAPPIEVTMDPEIAAPESPTAPPVTPSISPANQDAIAALFRGMKLSEKDAEAATLEEITAIGARLRECVDGLMFLLRTRTEEKQKIRAAQTVIASSSVNPLKFLANTDEALLAIIRGPDDSYLSGDRAVTAAYRDLADHHVRTWTALQAALRRMIDHFDPEEVEREIDETGLLEKLVAGGRSAKMWQIYQERYSEIAKAAEDRFLGEVGAEFRDAYESERT